MSWRPTLEPATTTCAEPRLSVIIDARKRDIGSLSVRRLLPSPRLATLGPFVYMDHMGPHAVATAGPIDVPQHPHINLSTLTYLFDGELTHRDSTGATRVIRPLEINWMTAGKGVVHSERASTMSSGSETVHGIQVWTGLPEADEEVAPWFKHYPKESFQPFTSGGAQIILLVGRWGNATSPVETYSPTLFCDVTLEAGARLLVPDRYSERGLYVVDGKVVCGQEVAEAGRMLVFALGQVPEIVAEARTRCVVLGGEPLDGKRHIWWNFVSSRPERIEQAARDWAEGRFPSVPDDKQDSLRMPPPSFPWRRIPRNDGRPAPPA